MKYFDWSIEKNEKLKVDRGLAFEDAINTIFEGGLLETVDHPNKKKYGNQKMYIIEIDEYAYLVPFVEDEEKVFLKTIIPSRKATRDYLLKKRRRP